MKKILYLSILCSNEDKNTKLESQFYDPAPFQFNRQVVNGLNANHCQVTCLSHVANYSEKTLSKEYGIDFINFKRYKNYFCNQCYLYLSIAKETKKWCKENPDGCVIVDAMDSFLASAVVRQCNLSIAIVTDSTYFNDHTSLLDKLNYQFFKQIIQHAKGYVFLTQQMSRLYNPYKPYTVVEALYDEKEVYDEEYLEKPICMYAGAVDKQYGLINLIEAFRYLEELNLKLEIYGPISGEDITQNLPHNVVYKGMVSRDQILLREREVMMLINPRPTLEEFTQYSFPSKTIEYLASGTVTLSTKLPGIPIEYSPYLYWIEEESPMGISETIRNVYNLKFEERKKFSEKAKQFVKTEKNSSRQTMKIINLIDML